MGLLEDLLADDPIPQLVPAAPRSTRFSGESQRCLLAQLDGPSQAAARALYEWLVTISQCGEGTAPSADVSPLRELIDQEHLSAASGWARQLAPVVSTRRMTRILHDVRGAALLQLIAIASFFEQEPDHDDLLTVMVLAADHAKVLRHSLLGVDEGRRLTDGAERRHGVANLRRRLASLRLHGRGGRVAIDFAATWDGDFATTCPEFSTVLKQVYHLLDNASRYTIDGRVSVRIFPKPARAPLAVRIAVANSLDEAQRARLGGPAGEELWRGFSTTGGGVGLASAAELVGEAFGLPDAETAIRQRLVGSCLGTAGYVAWFHWPTLAVAAVDADEADDAVG